MSGSYSQTNQLERVPSGIPGLDVILNGGFFRGGVYMLMGSPGAGKTVMGNQICFNHVKAGGRAIYVTLLAETHARMIMHLKAMSFFDPSVVGEELYYISGYQLLEKDGLGGLLKLLRQIVRDRKATLLVLDGLAAAGAIAESSLTYKRFLHELQVQLESTGATGILLTQPTVETGSYSEHTMVDGLVTMTDQLAGQRAIREIEVPKFRGSGYLRGKHMFEITGDGIRVYPRTESLYASLDFPPATSRERMTFNVSRLDEMLHGGLLSGSTTMILGAPGSGKTVLGMHFLCAGALKGERGLYFGFYETPPHLIQKMDQLGLDLSGHVERGSIELVWRPPLEDIADALVQRLLEAVERSKVRRLFVDSLHVFHDSTLYPERMSRFFTALSNELRARGVTTIFAVEMPELFSPNISVPLERVSAITDNIFFLRYVELRSQLYRLISILKVRESGYEPAIREFRISENGIEVASTFESAEAILTGIARPSTVPIPIPAQQETFRDEAGK